MGSLFSSRAEEIKPKEAQYVQDWIDLDGGLKGLCGGAWSIKLDLTVVHFSASDRYKYYREMSWTSSSWIDMKTRIN